MHEWYDGDSPPLAEVVMKPGGLALIMEQKQEIRELEEAVRQWNQIVVEKAEEIAKLEDEIQLCPATRYHTRES